jgi:hypothetical protein
MTKGLQSLTERLYTEPPFEHVFNPWRQIDREHDIGPQAPKIRRHQLEAYLRMRLDAARYVLMGEALGYQGGHFSGLAMTSERILLGFQESRGVQPGQVLGALKPERTSKSEVKEKGFTEPTATIVWGELAHLLPDARRAVLWNVFAWHPYDPQAGLLSNRRPSKQELERAIPALRAFISLFPQCEYVAVGKVAEDQLTALGVPNQPVRHPAQGGARRFRSEIRDLLGSQRPSSSQSWKDG